MKNKLKEFTFLNKQLSLISTNGGFDAATGHIAVILLLSLLFGINLSLLHSKLRTTQSSQKTSIGSTTIASAPGILFAGCTSGGLTLASYAGLGSLAAALPGSGIEVDIIVVFCSHIPFGT